MSKNKNTEINNIYICPKCKNVIINGIKDGLFNIGNTIKGWGEAFVNGLKEEKIEVEWMLAFSQLMLVLCKEYYTLLPSLESFLSSLTSQLKRFAKKKVNFRIFHLESSLFLVDFFNILLYNIFRK